MATREEAAHETPEIALLAGDRARDNQATAGDSRCRVCVWVGGQRGDNLPVVYWLIGYGHDRNDRRWGWGWRNLREEQKQNEHDMSLHIALWGTLVVGFLFRSAHYPADLLHQAGFATQAPAARARWNGAVAAIIKIVSAPTGVAVLVHSRRPREVLVVVRLRFNQDKGFRCLLLVLEGGLSGRRRRAAAAKS